MEQRAFQRIPLQVNGKCSFSNTQESNCHQCILMDVSTAGIGLLVSSPLPIGRDMKVDLEFPLQCRIARASIDLKWSRPLNKVGAYNWAAGGLWSEIDETDKLTLIDFAADKASWTDESLTY